ncbi:MAG TPA: hypothetical protein VIL65_07715 [Beijerinckiaceae bacterium]
MRSRAAPLLASAGRPAPALKGRGSSLAKPLAGAAVLALIGTGVLAYLDRSQQAPPSARAAITPAVTPKPAPAPAVVQRPAAVPQRATELERVPPSAPAVTPSSEVASATPAPATPPAPTTPPSAPLATTPVPPVPSAPPPAAAVQPPAPAPQVLAAVPPPGASAPAVPLAAPEPPKAVPTPGGVELAKNVDLSCLPDTLRNVLADTAAKFGKVTVVSAHVLNTDNHSPGSTREKLHLDCKAADFRVQADATEVMAYLRSRRELNGINSYRNGVFHIDVPSREARTTAGPAPRARSANRSTRQGEASPEPSAETRTAGPALTANPLGTDP